MSKCEKIHEEKDHRSGRKIFVPHQYIAGICVTHMTPPTLAFLEYTFPDYQSEDYESSKRRGFSYSVKEN